MKQNFFHSGRFLRLLIGILLLSFLFLVASPGVIAQDEAKRRPNIILLITDDQGYGEMSVHGNPILKTPNLDRLHDESIRFTNFHVAPMCTPTRGQLMTGVDCLRNRAMNVSSGRTLLRTDLPTMPELLSEAGYSTGHFGKWHLGDNYPYRPHDRGFHEAIWYPSSHIGSVPDYWDNDYFDDTYWHNDTRRRFDGYTTDVFFQEAMRWMKSESEAGRPFFCYLATAAPHSPFYVPAAYREEMEKRIVGKLPDDLNEETRIKLTRYLAMIENIDDNLGRLESFLSETELRENTLFIFLTDNGTTFGHRYFNAGMRGCKATLWEGGHRVPCFIRWPAGNLRATGDVSGLCEVQDLLPTLLDLADGTPNEKMQCDGISLAGVLKGMETPPEDRMLVIQFSRMNVGNPTRGDACVMWRNWRLVREKELFNLENDPAQRHNVITQYPEIADRMKSHYDSWWQGMEPQLNEPLRVQIGCVGQDDILLSPCEWWNAFLDLSAQVRNGTRRNGTTHLDVKRTGEYEFELRRWPREREKPFRADLPQTPIVDGFFPVGVSLPIYYVRLQIADFDQTVAVNDSDVCTRFHVHLQEGPTEMKTWFLDREHNEISGAYFVYARYLEDE